MSGHDARDILHKIEQATEEGKLWEPEELVEELLLSNASDFRRRQLLLMQVAVAKDKRDGRWLSEVAGFCCQMGFGYASDGWVERHVAEIPDWGRQHAGNPRQRWLAGYSSSHTPIDQQRSRPAAATGSSGGNARRERAAATSSSGAAATSSSGEGRSPVVKPNRERSEGSKRPREDESQEQDWVLVDRRRKRNPEKRMKLEARRISPIRWDDVKVRWGEGCWRCGEWDHYRRDCRKELGQREGGHSSSVATKVQSPPTRREETIARPRPCGSSASGPGTKRIPPKVRVDEPRQASLGPCSSSAVDPTRRKTPKVKECPVPWCTGNFANRKGHIYGYHYPTALAKQNDRHEGLEDTELRVNALLYLAGALVGSSASIQDLIDFLNEGRLSGLEECEIDEWTDGVVVDIARMLGLVAPQVPTCVPLNSPGCIFHYKVMLRVVALLGERGHYLFNHLFGRIDLRSDLRMRIPLPRESPPRTEPARELLPVQVAIGTDGGRRVSCSSSTATEVSCTVTEQQSCSSSMGRPSCSVPAVQGEESCSSSVVTVPTEDRPSVIAEVQEEELSEPMECEVRLSDLSESESPRRSWRPPREVASEHSDREVEEDRRVVKSKAIDSHFHLDRLCRDLGIPINYKRALDLAKPEKQEDQVEVEGAVAVFCDPRTYPTGRFVQELRQENVVSVIGLHPSRACEAGALDSLKGALNRTDIVGLGEVGLDGTKPNVREQEERLREILPLLKDHPDWVLVLHCRPGPGETVSSAYFHLFYMCKYVVPVNQRIHLHCFSGTLDDVDLWLGRFPNTYFGFTGMVTRGDFSDGSKLALKNIEASRILLESDAPYFRYGQGNGGSSPAFVGMTALDMARIRGCSREEILRVTAENARRLYWH